MKLRYSVQKQIWSYLFVAPALLLFIWFTLIPVVQAGVMAFYRYDPFRGGSAAHPLFVGWQNFLEVARDPTFWRALRNTGLFVLGVVPPGAALALLFAFALHPLHRRLQTAFKSAFYLPSVASEAVLALVWFWIFHPTLGLLNDLLGLAGAEPVYWLADPKWALPALMLMTVISGWGVNVILFSTALDAIEPELYAAAALDGAGRGQRFRHITLPLLRPAILFVVVVNTINALQVFTPVYMMTRGGPGEATQTAVYLIYETAFTSQQLGKAAAQAAVLFVVILLFAGAQFFLMRTKAES